MVEAATFHCGSSSVMTGRRGGRSTVRLPKRTAGSKTEPTVERPSDSADDDGRFLPDICRLGRRPWHRFLYLSHTEGAPRNTARGLPRPPKYSLDTAVTAAYDFRHAAQVACEKPRRFAARGFFIGARYGFVILLRSFTLWRNNGRTELRSARALPCDA